MSTLEADVKAIIERWQPLFRFKVETTSHLQDSITIWCNFNDMDRQRYCATHVFNERTALLHPHINLETQVLSIIKHLHEQIEEYYANKKFGSAVRDSKHWSDKEMDGHYSSSGRW